MDEDGLPVVGPGVDYTKVPPIQQKRTLAFLNYYIVRTTSFLNHFGSVCDEKLEDLLIRIQRLEASMCILEAKLSSIPGLENVTARPAAAQNDEDNPPIHSAPIQNGTTAASNAEKDPVPEKREEEQHEPENTVSKDPRFAKYFKMLNVGIPLGAVQIKMKSEGVDPDILNNPNAPASTVTAPASQSANSDSEESSFSD